MSQRREAAEPVWQARRAPLQQHAARSVRAPGLRCGRAHRCGQAAGAAVAAVPERRCGLGSGSTTSPPRARFAFAARLSLACSPPPRQYLKRWLAPLRAEAGRRPQTVLRACWLQVEQQDVQQLSRRARHSHSCCTHRRVLARTAPGALRAAAADRCRWSRRWCRCRAQRRGALKAAAASAPQLCVCSSPSGGGCCTCGIARCRTRRESQHHAPPLSPPAVPHQHTRSDAASAPPARRCTDDRARRAQPGQRCSISKALLHLHVQPAAAAVLWQRHRCNAAAGNQPPPPLVPASGRPGGRSRRGSPSRRFPAPCLCSLANAGCCEGGICA